MSGEITVYSETVIAAAGPFPEFAGTVDAASHAISVRNNSIFQLIVKVTVGGTFFVPPASQLYAPINPTGTFTINVDPNYAPVPSTPVPTNQAITFELFRAGIATATITSLGTASATGSGSNVIVTNFADLTFHEKFKTTVIDVPVTPAAPLIIPSSILVDRLALMLQSSFLNDQLIYVGGSTVTADETSTGGAQMQPGATFPIDTSKAIPYVITSKDRATALHQKIIVIEAA